MIELTEEQKEIFKEHGILETIEALVKVANCAEEMKNDNKDI